MPESCSCHILLVLIVMPGIAAPHPLYPCCDSRSYCITSCLLSVVVAVPGSCNCGILSVLAAMPGPGASAAASAPASLSAQAMAVAAAAAPAEPSRFLQDAQRAHVM
eukprot:scaffold80269_cov18-Tisochrysis_lutea.AAC.1